MNKRRIFLENIREVSLVYFLICDLRGHAVGIDSEQYHFVLSKVNPSVYISRGKI